VAEQWRAELETDRRVVDVDRLSSERLTEWSAKWALRLRSPSAVSAEFLEVALPCGASTGARGPRWLFHLLGIPHRASYVILTNSCGLMVLQRRSPAKADYPDAWDLTASGHVSEDTAEIGSGGFRTAALREIQEELGILSVLSRSVDETANALRGRLVALGQPRQFEPEQPYWWHRDLEVRQLFGGVLADERLAEIRPQPEEVAGVYLCTTSEARQIQAQEARSRASGGRRGGHVAPGAYSLFTAAVEWVEGHTLG